MKIGLVVNDLEHERPRYATTVLAMALRRMGHQARYVTLEGWVCGPDDAVVVRCHPAPDPPDEGYDDDVGESWLEELRASEARMESLSDFDVVLLRSDPAQETGDRRWAAAAGIIFGQHAVRADTLVLNDPFGLSQALNKLYFESFPEEARPRTLVTRDPEDIRRFYECLDGKMVLKPLQGSGGQSVFLVGEEEEANLSQMIEAILRDGYVVAQEFLPAGGEGDLRLFLMNGRPLRRNGRYAALYRESPEGDLRSNLHAGGTARAAEVTEDALRLAELVRPRLVADGMFLVGLDIAGDKLLEVNVFSPGGLHSIQAFEETDFARSIVEALERKVDVKKRYGRHSNRELACL